ncbi:DUF255 domain-containing protein [Pelagibacteraceae bacterium]|nr:DUF255 domain-containing protein [Pelagibacteraceae bacterium]
MINNLANDPSPYLQQHKDNPVHWQLWSKDTLDLAKKQKKPILLSIGYSSCHWCHVMAHESFEDKETAGLMNNNFINIKVDREERPDIDFIFQSSFQLFNQSGGGWPLTMFLDERGIPFMGGTYFPKEEKNGLPSFKTILQKVSEAYTEQREKIINQSILINKSLELKKNAVIKQEIEPIIDSVIDNLDPIRGGYKGSPKFPIFNVYDTLLYFFNKKKSDRYLKPVKLVLKQLCSQGIYDHVEGGISRYTVDEDWLIPHFEKMLYDNVQFISLLSKYSKIQKNEYFINKTKQTIEFLNNNFLNREFDLLGSAYDADSEGVEGKYYVYEYSEIKHIKDLEKYFEIKPEGNWEKKIILKELSVPTNSVLEELIKIRKTKKKPFFDNKTQLDLNSLWVSSLIQANSILPEQGYLKLAEKFCSHIESKFCKNSLYHSYSKNLVFIEDYAYFIQMLLDLSDATLNIKYRIKAKETSYEAIKYFYISDKNIFQKNKILENDIFFNPIDISDHTIPNGNSIMLMNFTRLGLIEEGKKLHESLNGYLNVYKNYMTSSLKSLDYFNETLNGKKCDEEGCSR